MQIIPLALYAFLCLLIGILGRHTRVGGVALFLLSIIFTPLLVGIVLALTVPKSQLATNRSAKPQNSN